MKTTCAILLLFVAVLLLAGCILRINENDVRLSMPSDVLITEERQVSGFNAVDFNAYGQVIFSQGESESLTIKGSDNIVPLVKTTVSGGTLKISMEENVNIIGINSDCGLTFTITVKDLQTLTVSGAGKVVMDALSTTELNITMRGAGEVRLDRLTADSLSVNISGAGNVEIAGEVAAAKFNISGAGPVNAHDLKIQTANISIPGLGGATLWVTRQLSVSISGAGNVSYYGNPRTDISTTGLGNFKSLGSK